MIEHVRITSICTLEEASKWKISMVSVTVPAGFPSPTDDYLQEPLDLNEYVMTNPSTTYFVRASGNSMRNASIHNGDILVVNCSDTARSGKVVIAVIKGNMVIKRLREYQGKWYLISENKDYSPLKITEEIRCYIWGVVTHALHTIE